MITAALLLGTVQLPIVCMYTIALLGGLGFGVKEPELPVFASQILLTDPGSYLYAGTELLYFQGGPQT
jgi:hypothetical protein